MAAGRWDRVQLSIKTKVRKCPDCRALVEDDPDDQRAHMEAHYPEPIEMVYEFADGVTVERPASAWRQVRDILRIRRPEPAPEPAPEAPTYTARQVRDLPPPEDFEARAVKFRELQATLGRINGNATHGD